MSRTLAGLFTDRAEALAAQRMFHGAGYEPERITLLSAVDYEVPVLRHQGECILRWAVRWGIIGALALEVPIVVALFFLPVDTGIRIFLAASVWKVGGLIGAWFGALAGQEHGLEAEVAQRYERHLRRGRTVLAVHMPRKERPSARGILVESGAFEAQDVDGLFEARAPALVSRRAR